GRIRLGIGVGDTGAQNLGVPRASLSELARAVGTIRALLAGEAVSSDSHALRLAYAPIEHSVPIYIAASGARTQQLCGRIADGALISSVPDGLKTAIEAVRSGEREAGRAVGSTRILFWTTASVDSDRQRARAAVRGGVGRRALNTLGRLARSGELPESDRAAYERLKAVHDSGRHHESDYAPVVPEEWIDRFAIAGTPVEVRERLQRAIADGADEIGTILQGPRPGDRGVAEQLTRFAESVLEPMRREMTAEAR
ncbi:MAG: LLM class flavin-dependent oxidoreductase, partial [Chloroflexi bacterium]|nr:LLM class flavin-dependent oxidoreductase [Chloroflexota bacterium]